MGRRRKEIPAGVAAVGKRIDRWRQTRARRTRMPEELWRAAAAAAAKHGIWFVSRVLRVNYDSLRQHMACKSEQAVDGGGGFVELEAGELLVSRQAREAVLELSRPDGTSMRMRLSGQAGLDVLALARAFWDHDR